jgi:hypothetical protein
MERMRWNRAIDRPSEEDPHPMADTLVASLKKLAREQRGFRRQARPT